MLLTNLNDWQNVFENNVSEELPDSAKWVNGRVIAVLASPELQNAISYATGVSIVPPGTSTPWHSHKAEELALIVKGKGVISIGHDHIEVIAGDVVRTPPGIKHQTVAGDDSELVVFWVYAPPGSETRWFDDAPQE